jgi:hypothetical protein
MISAEATGHVQSKFHALQFRLLQLLITLALILCIVGGTSSVSSTGAYTPQTTTKAGEVIYIIAFLILAVIAGVVATKLSHARGNDKMLVWAVILALPFILVRIIYSVISVFGHNPHFSLVTGSVVIHVFMSVLEEMIVVFIYLAIGWKTEPFVSSNQAPSTNRPWKGNLANMSTPQGGNERYAENTTAPNGGNQGYANNTAIPQGVNNMNSVNAGASQGREERRTRQDRTGRLRRKGPIHALVGAGIAAVQQRKEDKAARGEAQM